MLDISKLFSDSSFSCSCTCMYIVYTWTICMRLSTVSSPNVRQYVLCRSSTTTHNNLSKTRIQSTTFRDRTFFKISIVTTHFDQMCTKFECKSEGLIPLFAWKKNRYIIRMACLLLNGSLIFVNTVLWLLWIVNEKLLGLFFLPSRRPYHPLCVMRTLHVVCRYKRSIVDSRWRNTGIGQ